MNTAAFDRPLGFECGEASLYALTGKLLGLKAVHSEVDLIERLEKGLTIATVHSLRVRANLTDAETYQLIAPRAVPARVDHRTDRPRRHDACPIHTHEQCASSVEDQLVPCGSHDPHRVAEGDLRIDWHVSFSFQMTDRVQFLARSIRTREHRLF